MAQTALLFDQATIAARVESLAGELAQQLPEDFLIVGLLKGSFVFVADLLRALHRHGKTSQVEFMRLSSYGPGMVSAGEVHLLADIPGDIAGRTILLVDDIVDTGQSLAYAMALLERRDAGPIATCALLDKPSRRLVPVRLDFRGFAIDDLFVAGYGIDYAERYRELPDVVVVAPEEKPA